MADEADVAFELASELVSRGLSTIERQLAPGVAGECDECGEMMPRLVGGRCGFCRDGRRPPAESYERAAQRLAHAPVAAPSRETIIVTKPTTEDFKTISVPARGDVLRAIVARALGRDLPLGQAVLSLIEDALAPREAEAPADCTGHAAEVLLANVPDDLFAQEAVRRITAGVCAESYDAAIGRAEAAEARLAAVRAAMGESVG